MATVLVALLFLACSGDDEMATQVRRNVLLVSIDTLRADHLTCYGYDRDTSPVIDSLSQRGVLFENAFSQAPKTALSHMSIFTGVQPAVHRVEQWSTKGNERLSPSIPTLPGLLRAAGYRTAAVTGGSNVGADLGFDEGVEFFSERYDLPETLKQGLLELEEAKAADRPFFLFLHTYQVHAPYLPPMPYRDRYIDPSYSGAITADVEELRRVAGDDWGAQRDEYWSRVDPESEADLQRLRDLYDAEIRYTDEMLGRLVARMGELGQLQKTMIVLLSDHGEEFMEHGNFDHEQVYQELLHVPLILVFPDNDHEAARGVRLSNVVRLIDVMPTILDYLGIDRPGHLQGASLLPAARGDATTSSMVVSSWRWAGFEALRAGRWKLIRHDREKKQGVFRRLFLRVGADKEVYDLLADPEETANLAAERPDIVSELEEVLDREVKESMRLREGMLAGETVMPDDETVERLRALGYL